MSYQQTLADLLAKAVEHALIRFGVREAKLAKLITDGTGLTPFGATGTVFTSNGAEGTWAPPSGGGPTTTTLATTLMGAYASFTTMAAAGITNTGNTTVAGDIGTYPTASIAGFPPGTFTGTEHAADATAQAAHTQVLAAQTYLQGQSLGSTLSGDIGGTTLTPGNYHSTSTLGITGTLTMDAQGNPNARFIIQLGSALTTAASSVVKLVNGASAQNIAWLCGSAATLGASSTFAGTLLANTGITLGSGVTMNGRLLDATASITLIDDTLTNLDSPIVPVTEFSQLSDVNVTSPTNAQVLRYNSSTNQWTNVAMSGDVTTTNAGVETISAGAVTLAKLAAGVAPAFIVKFAGNHTTVGGSATEAFTVAGVLSTDVLLVTQRVQTGATTLLSAIPSTNTITVVYSADPSSTTVVAYTVLRAAS